MLKESRVSCWETKMHPPRMARREYPAASHSSPCFPAAQPSPVPQLQAMSSLQLPSKPRAARLLKGSVGTCQQNHSLALLLGQTVPFIWQQPANPEAAPRECHSTKGLRSVCSQGRGDLSTPPKLVRASFYINQAAPLSKVLNHFPVQQQKPWPSVRTHHRLKSFPARTRGSQRPNP